MLAHLVSSIATVAGCAALAVCLMFLARRIYQNREPENDLLERVDSILPQTQCAQCGYAGCSPYAQAIVADPTVPLNLCPPGGEDVAVALGQLLGRETTLPDSEMSLSAIAAIDEENCIGCGRCHPVCPVDAIVGAEDYVHTVLTKHCTGCELCVLECPVDCISMSEPDVD